MLTEKRNTCSGRDPERIEPFLEELARLWHKVPDWRFGQLMLNFQYWLNATSHGDGFYLEEDKYLELFKNFMEEKTRR